MCENSASLAGGTSTAKSATATSFFSAVLATASRCSLYLHDMLIDIPTFERSDFDIDILLVSLPIGAYICNGGRFLL